MVSITPHAVVVIYYYNGWFRDYCTITTLGSQGVTRDAREHYLTVFTGEIWP